MSPIWRKYAHDARTLPRDAARAYRERGIAGPWHELRRRTLDRVWTFRRSLVVESDLAGLASPALPDGIAIAAFAGPDWSVLGELAPERLHPRFAAAVAAGRRCTVAWREGRAVAFAWASRSLDRGHERFELPLPPDAVYLWHVLVVPSERGRGVGAAVVRSAALEARRAGARRAWSVVHRDNHPSLRIASTIGGPAGRIVGSVTRVQLFTWTRSRYRAGPGSARRPEEAASCATA